MSSLPSLMLNNSCHQRSSTQKTRGPSLSVMNLVPFLLCYRYPQFLCFYAGIPTNHHTLNTPKLLGRDLESNKSPRLFSISQLIIHVHQLIIKMYLFQDSNQPVLPHGDELQGAHKGQLSFKILHVFRQGII